MVVERERTVAAAPEAVWELVSDPHMLPRWWPGVQRVEEVTGIAWTKVLRTPNIGGFDLPELVFSEKVDQIGEIRGSREENLLIHLKGRQHRQNSLWSGAARTLLGDCAPPWAISSAHPLS